MSSFNQQSQNHPPLIRLSEAYKLQIGLIAWAALSSYKLESVKVEQYQQNVRSSAIVKVKDVISDSTMLFKGDHVATLLGVSMNQWKEIEKLSKRGQIFYRPFKNGLNSSFPMNQQMFYHFCDTVSSREVLFVMFKKVPNIRKNEANVPFLEVLDCSLPSPKILKMYNFSNIL